MLRRAADWAASGMRVNSRTTQPRVGIVAFPTNSLAGAPKDRNDDLSNTPRDELVGGAAFSVFLNPSFAAPGSPTPSTTGAGPCPSSPRRSGLRIVLGDLDRHFEQGVREVRDADDVAAVGPVELAAVVRVLDDDAAGEDPRVGDRGLLLVVPDPVLGRVGERLAALRVVDESR